MSIYSSVPTIQRHASLACHMLTTRPHIRAFVKSLATPRSQTTTRTTASAAADDDNPAPLQEPPLEPLKPPRPVPTSPPLETLLQSVGALAALEPGCTAIAVDPDTSGAIAIVHLERANAMWTVCTTLHDMPLVEVPIGRRFRRLPSATGILSTLGPLLMHAGSPHSGLLHHLADVAEGHAAINAASAGHQQHPSATHDNGSNCSYGSGTWRLVNQAGTNGLTNIHRTHFDKEALFAVVEAPTPGPLTGKFAWYQGGYALATWHAVLGSCGVPMVAVRPSVWKRGLGLTRQGKDGSRALAMQLFPETQPLLRRKKDHGRAEALLLAAWALGVRYSTKRGMHVMEGTAEGLPVEERAEGRPVEERAEGLTDESDAREEQRDDACKDLAC